MEKICFITNIAPIYHKAIYKKLDNEFNIDWYFSEPNKYTKGIKTLPISFFKSASIIESKHLFGPFTTQKKVVRLLCDKKYNTYFMLGEITAISSWSFAILHTLFYRKKNIYTWGHGILRKRSLVREIMNKFYYKMFSGIFIYGNHARNFMIADKFDDGNRLWVIHNSLDYDKQIKFRNNFTKIYINHFRNKYPVIFFIGRLTAIKKLDLLISAINLLKKQGYPTNLTLIGEGDTKKTLIKQTTDLGLNEFVWFYGECYNEKEKGELITNADLCVSPGNIGLTAIDSLMYGTPIITMDNYNKQMPEYEAIKKGETGDFFKENNIDDLANKIFSWLTNGHDRENIRQNCYKVIDKEWNPDYQMKVFKEHLNI